jgi:hypothetical protein
VSSIEHPARSDAWGGAMNEVKEVTVRFFGGPF